MVGNLFIDARRAAISSFLSSSAKIAIGSTSSLSPIVSLALETRKVETTGTKVSLVSKTGKMRGEKSRDSTEVYRSRMMNELLLIAASQCP